MTRGIVEVKEYSVIGKSIPRVDAVVKATGQARYTADLELPRMLYGKILRSPYPHARILNIDTSQAEKLSGVKATVTGKDFGGFKKGILPNTRDEEALPVDRVRYVGEGVVGVAAIDEDIAEEALQLIKVEYEELPGVFDPEEAMKEGAPRIHEHSRNNVSWENHYNFGDVEKGFTESDYVREDRFATSKVLHGFMEPQAVLANWDSEGKITFWGSKQAFYLCYRQLSLAFGVPLDNIRVIQPYIGGGFGGKYDLVDLDFCAVLLSKKTGRPVKMYYTQKDVLTAGRRRTNMIVDLRTGVKKDGTLVASHYKVIADGGAYTLNGPITMYLAGALTTLPYRTPNVRYDAYRVFTNKPGTAPLRGHGASHTRFAADVQLDMIAQELGIDPVEIRLKNSLQTGDVTANQFHITSCGLTECLEKLAADVNWKEKKGRQKVEGNVARGIGIGCYGFISGGRIGAHDYHSAIVKVNEDGTINLFTGAPDIGQGSETVLSQIAAEAMGIDFKDVKYKMIDSDFTPMDIGTFSSRVTYMSGNAVILAVADAKEQLKEIAAKVWGVNGGDIEFKDRNVFVRDVPDKAMPFRRLTRIVDQEEKKSIIGKGYYSLTGVPPMSYETGEGDASEAYSFGAQVSEVEVDMETGQVKVTRSTLAHDCGIAINPMAADGQLQGSTVQAQGQVLHEDFIFENGKTLNTSFLDYKIPSSLDVPKEIKGISVETEVPGGPFGAKEAGEGIIVGAPPSIVNAIHDATGIWFRDLPVTPAKLLKALKEQGKS
jgi:4-hydroxybenzoyl-CoA reductase subunit alpha